LGHWRAACPAMSAMARWRLNSESLETTRCASHTRWRHARIVGRRPLHVIVSFAMLVHNSEPEQHKCHSYQSHPTRPSLAISSDLFRSNVPLRLASEICKELPIRVRAARGSPHLLDPNGGDGCVIDEVLHVVGRPSPSNAQPVGVVRRGFRCRLDSGFAGPPSWEEVHRRMQHDGRRSKVNDPSEAHRRLEIPAPFFRPTGELRFK
jgi:hypothetical protein